jgi:DNA-binding NarL/FixJ family response regulator
MPDRLKTPRAADQGDRGRAVAALTPADHSPETLLRAITEVMAGRIALSPDIDHEFAISRLANEPSAIDTLSPREFEILRMLLAEKSVDDIASTLHISVKTAANTRYQIHARLGVGSDIELVRLALRQRIIAAEDIGGEPDPRPLADRRHHVSAKNEAIGSSAQP